MVLGVMLGLIMVLSATYAGCVCPRSNSNDGFHYGSECCLTRFYAAEALILGLIMVLGGKYEQVRGHLGPTCIWAQSNNKKVRGHLGPTRTWAQSALGPNLHLGPIHWV